MPIIDTVKVLYGVILMGYFLAHKNYINNLNVKWLTQQKKLVIVLQSGQDRKLTLISYKNMYNVE